MAVTALAANALLNQPLEFFTVLPAYTVRTSMKQKVSPSTQCHRSTDARKPPHKMGGKGSSERAVLHTHTHNSSSDQAGDQLKTCRVQQLRVLLPHTPQRLGWTQPGHTGQRNTNAEA